MGYWILNHGMAQIGTQNLLICFEILGHFIMAVFVFHFHVLFLGTKIGTTSKMVPFYGLQNCILVMMYKLRTLYFLPKILTQSPVFGTIILSMKYAIQQFSQQK